MGLFGKLSKSINDWIHEDETSIFESPPPDRAPSKDNVLRDESIMIKRLYKWVKENIESDCFGMSSIEFLYEASGGESNLKDEAIVEFRAAIEPIYAQKNRDFWSSQKSEAEYKNLLLQAKCACQRFIRTINERDFSSPYSKKCFSLSGTFKYGTQKAVAEILETKGMIHTSSTYYADYIIIGCKTTKRHPLDDFSDVVAECRNEMGDYDGYHRIVVAEYDFELLK